MGKNLVENLVVVFLMMTASLRIIISLYLDTVSLIRLFPVGFFSTQFSTADGQVEFFAQILPIATQDLSPKYLKQSSNG